MPGFALEWLLIICVAYFYCGEWLLDFDATKLQQTGEHNESSTLPLLAEIGLSRYREIPLWNPYMLTGYPHVGDFLGHFWNPISTLPILTWGGINGMKVSIFLSFIIAGLGQWLFAHTLGVGRLFRLWSSILFLISGGLALLWRVGWYELLLGAAWFPACFALYLRALQTGTVAAVGLVSVAIFMVISTGGGYYPLYLLVSMATVFALAILRAPSDTRTHFIRTSVWIVLLSALLCAVILVPYLDGYRYSVRDVPPDFHQHFSQPIPYALINYIVHSPEWFRATILGTAGGWNWFYIGWLPVAALAFVPLALSRSPRRRGPMLISGTLLVVLLLWFANQFSPVGWLYEWIPFLYNLRFPNRLLIIAACPLLLLAAHALEYTQRLSKGWAGSIKLVYRTSGHRRSAMPVRHLITAVWIAGLVVTTTTVYDVNRGFAFADQPLNAKALSVLKWVKEYDPSLYYINLGGGALYWDWTPAAYALEMPVINFLYSRYLRTRDIQRSDSSPFIAKAKYQFSRPDQPPPENARQLREIEGMQLWQILDALPYAFGVQPTVMQEHTKLAPDQVTALDVEIKGPNRVVVNGAPQSDGDVLVVLMSDYPGWQLHIDGNPAPVVSHNGYLGAKMIPGVHSYAFHFRPAQYVIGATISIATFVLLIGALVAAPVRRLVQVGATTQRNHRLTAASGS